MKKHRVILRNKKLVVISLSTYSWCTFTLSNRKWQCLIRGKIPVVVQFQKRLTLQQAANFMAYFLAHYASDRGVKIPVLLTADNVHINVTLKTYSAFMKEWMEESDAT